MKYKATFVHLGLAMALLVAMTGCETVGQSAGLGAVLGAGTGAVIGHQSGHALEGAAIGAAVGAATGAIAKDISNKRKASREQTVQQYPTYQPSQGLFVNLEEYGVIPSVVRPGGYIEATLTYALLGTGGSVSVVETRALYNARGKVADLSSNNRTREDGTWLSAQQIKLPNNLAPGQYTLQQIVNVGGNVVSGASGFTVQ
jgi:hypothetical protein